MRVTLVCPCSRTILCSRKQNRTAACFEASASSCLFLERRTRARKTMYRLQCAQRRRRREGQARRARCGLMHTASSTLRKACHHQCPRGRELAQRAALKTRGGAMRAKETEPRGMSRTRPGRWREEGAGEREIPASQRASARGGGGYDALSGVGGRDGDRRQRAARARKRERGAEAQGRRA